MNARAAIPPLSNEVTRAPCDLLSAALPRKKRTSSWSSCSSSSPSWAVLDITIRGLVSPHTPSIEEICAVVVCFDSILSRFTPPPFNLARELFALIRFNIRLHFLLFDGWQILKCILGNLGGARSGPWLDVRKWWRFFFSFSLMSENHVQPLPSWSGAKSRQLFSFFSHRRVIGKCG